MDSIIDHVGINVSSYAKSKPLYQAALAPLGIGLLMEFPDVGGFGKGRKAELWVSFNEARKTISPVHVCLKAKDRAEVDAFYAAAIAAGFVDNGPPGLRPQYHEGYYGAFVLDPDGHNIEAVFHG
jgi:catechol 2,3-dioxygenase-like lactoylglutathione lyase family enzyme